MRKLLLLVPLVLALVAAACSGGGSDTGSAGGTGGGGAELGTVTGRANAAAGSVDRAGSGKGGPVADAVPQVGPQIIQNGSLRVAVSRGRFDDAVDEARTVATSLGGFVVSSTASQGGERRLVRGTLVLRVPASSYGDAMERLRHLGKLEALDESGHDVSQEFVDLRARVRQLQAVESQLLELLDRAKTVPAALAVQSQLSQVQLDLEQARGRLNYLDDQVAFATISLTLHEAGIVPPKGDGGGFGIVDAWAKAGAGFLAVVGGIFVAFAVAAPVLVLLALGFLLGRIVRKRFAHA